jgi:hypothetical protein
MLHPTRIIGNNRSNFLKDVMQYGNLSSAKRYIADDIGCTKLGVYGGVKLPKSPLSRDV